MSSFLEGKRKTDTILVSMHSLPKKIREMEAVADDLVNRSTQEEDPVDTKRLSSDADKRKFVEDRRLRPAEEKKQREDKDLCECASRAEDEADKLREEEEKKKKKPERKGKQPQNKVKAPEAKPKEEAMKQQGQAAKRPQTPAPPTQQRYPPREVPPRFMMQAQKQLSKNKQKGQNDTEFIGWGDMNGGGSGWDKLVVDDRDRDSWPSIGGGGEVANCSSDSPWGAPGNLADAGGGGGGGGCCPTGSESANPCGHVHSGPTGSCSSSSSSGSGCDVTCVPSSSATSSSSAGAAGTAGGACVSGGVGGAVSSSGNAIASAAAVVTNLTNAGNSNISANAVGGASGGSCGSVITSSSPAVEGQWPSEASNGNGSSTSQGQGSNATLLLASHLCSGSSSSNTCSNSCSASPSPAVSAAINPTGTRNTNSHHGQAQQQSLSQASPMDVWGSASNLYRTLNSQANPGNNNNTTNSNNNNNNNSNAAPANQQGDAASHQEAVWGSRSIQECGSGADNGFGSETSSGTGNNSGEWRDANPQALTGAQQNGEQGGNGNCNGNGQGPNSNAGSNPNQSEGHVWGVSVVNNSNCSVAGGGLLNDNGTSGWGSSSNTGSGYGTRNGANDGWGATQGQWGSSSNNAARICAPPNANCGQGSNGVKPKGTWAQAACKGLSSSTSGDNNSGSCNVNNNINSSGNNNNGGSNCMVVPGGHQQASEPSTKKAEECDARISLTSHDGWGLGGVNQDTAWDVPGVQEPAVVLKDPAAPVVCRSTVSNGTEIWENSLRNGKGNSTSGSGSNPSVQQPPWGNNPTTNIGGMWGEDEDTSNVWTGMPSNSANAGNVSNNQAANMHNNSSNSAMWGSSAGAPTNDRKDKWGSTPSSSATGWGESNVSPYNGASSWSSPVSSPMTKSAQQQQQQGSVAPSGHPGQGLGMGPGPATNVSSNVPGHHGPAGLARIPSGGGVPGGVGPKEVKPTGWEEPSPPTPRRGVPNYDDGTSVWGNPHTQGKVSRWAGLSSRGVVHPGPASWGSWVGVRPDGANSAQPNLNRTQNPVPPPSVGSAGVIRIPTANTGLKGDPGTGIWGKPQTNSRSNSWNDGNAHDSMSSGWDDGPSNAIKGNCVGSGGGGGGGGGGNGGGSAGGWGEPGSPHSWSSKPKVSNWGDGQVVDTSNWGAPAAKQGGKLLTKDLIWASRPFRILCDLGYKKEDVENALRNNNMNFDDAMSDLTGNSGQSRDGNMDGHEGFGGMHSKLRNAEEEMNSIDNNTFNPNMVNVNNAHLYSSPVSQPGPFKSQGVGMNSLSGHHGNANANSAQIPNINLAPGANPMNQQTMIQKILLIKHQQQQQQQQQQVPPFQNLGQSFGGQDRVNQQSIPSTAQLRLIVQQIQTAVQAGHLNPQILNQPMAPQTLLLVNQLLQQIKHLQQLTAQQQLAQQHPVKGGANTALQLSVQITKTKQQITNLQNQITVQQAVFSKQQQLIQQQQQQQAMANDFLKPNLDPLALIQSGVQELALKDPTPTTPTQQSRLHQWKLPSIDKDLDHPTSPNSGPPPPLPMQPMTHSHAVNAVGDFSRAPGSIAKPTSLPQPLPSSLNTLFSQVDNTWALSRSQGDSGWPDSSSAVGSGGSVVSVNDSSVNGDKESQWSSLAPSSNQPSYNIGDLVAEFEPGKPWKGVPLKNIEDDPHITPGSVARSPLNSIKESDIFNSLSKSSSVSSASDSTYPPLSITNTWSFTSGTTASSPSYSSSGSVSGSPGSFQKKWPSEPHQHPHPPSPLTSELWGPPISKSRWPPPPGMGNAPGGMKVMGVSGGVPVGPSGGLGPGVVGSNAPNSSPGNSWGPPVSNARGGWNPDGRNPFPPVPSSGWDRQGASTWLMLRNLTPQIDGSTLKTLCMQHGPLVAFHLYLNQGIALVRYSSREEASKAQNALNSCVLGNTTIFADFANESDMNQFLQQSGHTMNANRSMANNTWGGPLPNSAPGSGIVGSTNNSTGAVTGTAVTGRNSGGNQHQGSSSGGFKSDPMSASHWNGANLNVHANAIWSMSSGSLWGTSNPNEHDQHRATPSSLNSFLPGDLLGGESV